jgi:hypothetical protein
MSGPPDPLGIYALCFSSSLPCRRKFIPTHSALLLGDAEREWESSTSTFQTAVKAHAGWLEAGPLVECCCGFCGEPFQTARALEEHIRGLHSHSCATCGREFVTEHWLTLHVQEAHDSYFRLLAARRPMYACLVESCGVKLGTQAERQRHAIDVHGFPQHASVAIARQRRRPRETKTEPAAAPAPPDKPPKPGRRPGRPTVPSESGATSRAPVRCRHFGTTNGCTRGAACRFVHTPQPDGAPSSLTDGAPSRLTGSEMHRSGDPRGVPAAAAAAMVDEEASGPPEDAGTEEGIAELTQALSALSTRVPANISFGRGRGRAYTRIGRK